MAREGPQGPTIQKATVTGQNSKSESLLLLSHNLSTPPPQPPISVMTDAVIQVDLARKMGICPSIPNQGIQY